MPGKLATPHGQIRLPAFFPDATRGVVRSLAGEDLEKCNVQGVMVNIFHLLSKPGIRPIAEYGGIHRFMNWHGPVAADSGGFQAYSVLDDCPKMGSISKKGFVYRLQKDSKKILLTPEKCIQTQFRLKADILFCLDYCTHPEDPLEKQHQSVSQTIAWARKCRMTYDRLVEQKQLPPDMRPLIMAVVQGGENLSLRQECAERLLEIGFDGYGYGGWPVTETGGLFESVAQVAELIPSGKPKFALGIGKPENLVRAFRLGYNLFDCVIPTRDARHRRVYVFNKPLTESSLTDIDFYHCIYLQDKKHSHDQLPLEDGCDCLCCQNYSRAYLHHLFKINDSLATRLATIHNVRFYRRLMAGLVAHQEREQKTV